MNHYCICGTLYKTCEVVKENEQQAKRIEELETTIKNACDLINDEGEVSKWKILNILNPTPKGK